MPAREGSDEDLGLANVILPNGSRYYVDHAHPEYSTPECITPRDLVVHDKAGERVLERSLAEVARELPTGPRLSIYKNNSDGKGNSYGTHENYLVDRATPFGDIVRDLTPFFVSRQVFCGAGKVGAEAPWEERGRTTYQLTQRADFFETEVGLETTLKRPIINTRDEPHADPEKYRRLHVIIGDANMCEVATFLKVGTTAIVLKMIEDRFLPDLSIQNPVAALHEVSRDITLHGHGAAGRRPAPVRGAAAVGVLRAREEVRGARGRHPGEPGGAGAMGVGARRRSRPSRSRCIASWTGSRSTGSWPRTASATGWTGPIPSSRRSTCSTTTSGASAASTTGWTPAGKVERLTTDEEVDVAVMEPPMDTRAYFRGRCISRYPEAIAAASWDSLIVDTGADALQRIPMREPLRGTREHVEDLLRGVRGRGVAGGAFAVLRCFGPNLP